MKTLNILIADDHPIFLKGLREVLEAKEEFNIIASVENGYEALEAAKKYSLDVVVLDVDMPRMNGLEASEKIQEIHPDLPIILLTMHKEKATFFKALEIGILGYVLKENAVTDVIHAIESVVVGNPFISPEMSSFLLKKSTRVQNSTKEDLIATLTPAETKILHLVAAYKTSKEIADELFISEKTVFNHRMNIAKKLNLTGKNSLLRFALEHLGLSH